MVLGRKGKFQAVSDYAIMGISGDTGGQSNSTGHILGAGLYHYSVVYKHWRKWT